MTPETFQHRLHTARMEWNNLLAALPPEQLSHLFLPNGWSLCELIAHITWYEREMVTLLRTRRFAGSPLWLHPPHERNEAIRAAAAEQSAADLLAESERVFDQFTALAADLTQDELRNAAHFQEMPANCIPWELIADNAFNHYAVHIPELERLLGA